MALRIDSAHQTKTTAVEHNSNPSRTSFGQTLANKQQLQSQELEQLLNKIDVQGQKLAQSLSLRDLIDFRDMIKTALRSTFGLSRNMGEESVWDYRGRPKLMARIQKIDHALEELGQKVLHEQDKSLEILAKIDEIRGLVIDLFA